MQKILFHLTALLRRVDYMRECNIFREIYLTEKTHRTRCHVFTQRLRSIFCLESTQGGDLRA